jgi:hypothetical protein
MQETYRDLQIVLQKIGYGEQRWNIWSDLNVAGMLTGLQGGKLNSANVTGTAKRGTAPLQNK